MSEQEEIKLFARIRENIQQTQRKLYERKAKLAENIVVTDEDGKPVIVKAEDYIKQFIK